MSWKSGALLILLLGIQHTYTRIYFLKGVWYSSSEERHNLIIKEKQKWLEYIEIQFQDTGKETSALHMFLQS